MNFVDLPADIRFKFITGLYSLDVYVSNITDVRIPTASPALAFQFSRFPMVVVEPDDAIAAKLEFGSFLRSRIPVNAGRSCILTVNAVLLKKYLEDAPLQLLLVDILERDELSILGAVCLEMRDFFREAINPANPTLGCCTNGGRFELYDIVGNTVATAHVKLRLISLGMAMLPSLLRVPPPPSNRIALSPAKPSPPPLAVKAATAKPRMRDGKSSAVQRKLPSAQPASPKKPTVRIPTKPWRTHHGVSTPSQTAANGGDNQTLQDREKRQRAISPEHCHALADAAIKLANRTPRKLAITRREDEPHEALQTDQFNPPAMYYANLQEEAGVIDNENSSKRSRRGNNTANTAKPHYVQKSAAPLSENTRIGAQQLQGSNFATVHGSTFDESSFFGKRGSVLDALISELLALRNLRASAGNTVNEKPPVEPEVARSEHDHTTSASVSATEVEADNSRHADATSRRIDMKRKRIRRRAREPDWIKEKKGEVSEGGPKRVRVEGIMHGETRKQPPRQQTELSNSSEERPASPSLPRGPKKDIKRPTSSGLRSSRASEIILENDRLMIRELSASEEPEKSAPNSADNSHWNGKESGRGIAWGSEEGSDADALYEDLVVMQGSPRDEQPKTAVNTKPAAELEQGKRDRDRSDEGPKSNINSEQKENDDTDYSADFVSDNEQDRKASDQEKEPPTAPRDTIAYSERNSAEEAIEEQIAEELEEG